jgi:hypothetical protein
MQLAIIFEMTEGRQIGDGADRTPRDSSIAATIRIFNMGTRDQK